MPKTFPLTPFASMLIIRPDKPEDKTAGGIIVPDSVKERPNKGTVVALGEDLAEKPVKLGDKLYHVKSGGLEFEVEGQIYVQLRYSDCLCKEV